MSLDEDLLQVEPIPKAEVRIPNRDPRRRNPNAKTAVTGSEVPPRSAPLLPLSTPVSAQALPSAITNKPAPAQVKLPKSRPPVVLTPSVSGASSF